MESPQQLKALTDLCVKCGMCLPACPTYQLTGDESESPRGRIALVQGFLSGALRRSPKLEQHLNHCLKCRSCERICPSAVPYGRIIDAGQTYIERAAPARRRGHALLLEFVKRRAWLHAAARAARLAQRIGIRRIAQRSGLLRLFGLTRHDALLPDIPPVPRWRDYYPPLGAARGDVGLFTGCVADVLDPRTTRAAIDVLTRLGYGVHLPRAQQCCGALHLHNQQPEHAADLARSNIAAFSGRDVIAILGTASGCTATLREYSGSTELAGNPDARAFSERVRDISEFLVSTPWPQSVTVRSRAVRVALHDPCTLTNVLRAAQHARELLNRIPELQITSLPDTPRCCGAAGNYMLAHPDIAEQLRDAKLSGIATGNIAVLATSNIGCALHLAAGLRKSGVVIEVTHPVVLLAQQL